jgi:sortase A
MVRLLRGFERAAWIVGLVLIAVYGMARVHGAMAVQRELDGFARAKQAAARALPAGDVDTSLWSAGRIEKYEQSLDLPAPPPLGLLRIPRIRLEVPVLDGTDELTLNRAVGHIASTSRPGEPGNVGIAGHRDGFFRGLKDIGPGDAIDLETLDGTVRYVVEEIVIVDPAAVEVLEPTAEDSLTLVTCYPFYYVGSAPQRYIVRAVRSDSAADRAASNGI